jgi:hypothetical protein
MSTKEALYAPRWVRSSEAPDWRPDEILPGLHMGGTADCDTRSRRTGNTTGGDGRRFDAVATLYAWAGPVDWEVEETRYGFGDGALHGTDLPRIIRVAIWAHARWKAGDQVLIRCQAGLNRSGLVTALVLLIEGWTPEAAIRQIRDQRSPWALCNDAFIDWLLHEAAGALRTAAPTLAQGWSA